jgi:hypothetical protein
MDGTIPPTELKLRLVENETTVWLRTQDDFIIVMSRVEYEGLDHWSKRVPEMVDDNGNPVRWGRT